MSLSHKQAAAMGWKRIDPRPWTTKLTARWRHEAGWTLVHCGHPTANFPWALYDPQARRHLQGAQDGNPTWGMAWRSCPDAMAFVHERGAEAIARMDVVAKQRPHEVRGGWMEADRG